MIRWHVHALVIRIEHDAPPAAARREAVPELARVLADKPDRAARRPDERRADRRAHAGADRRADRARRARTDRRAHLRRAHTLARDPRHTLA